MAGAVAVVLRFQIHLQVAQFRPLAQEVVPHQAVEVERRGRAGIGLNRRHFGKCFDDFAGLQQRPFRRLQRRTFGQIDDHLQLGFVVERQELHGAPSSSRTACTQAASQRRRRSEKSRRACACGSRVPRRGDRAGPSTPSPCAASCPADAPVVARRDLIINQGAKNDGHEEGEQHCGRGVRGDRRHVGAHEARHEHHRQQRRNDGQRRDDRRIADFGDRFDRA